MNKFLSMLPALALLLCGCGNTSEEPFFETRGLVLSWDDVKNPETIDWIGMMKEYGLNTISVCGHDYTDEEYLNFKQLCIDNGLFFEYEDHMMTWLLPNELFETHPEYFRMNAEGERVGDYNGCPSCQGALDVVTENAAKYCKLQYSTNHRYYFWLFDGGDLCHCEKCKNLNPADQALLFENAILKGLRQADPDAILCHLCYHNIIEAPQTVKPDDGIFLLFAPFFRTWDRPLSDREARRADQSITHGDYIGYLESNLSVFGSENAQVLEYWMDISQRSDWKKPAVKLNWNKEVFLEDLRLYASYGIKHVSAYAIYADADYFNAYHDLDFVKDYGEGLLNFKP